jgi:uncharacterized protein YwgA
VTTYQLAKLILMADGIQSRKRIQKTVHLLQAAGCGLGVDDFRLHYYGPYSAELAEKLDRMTATSLLIESTAETPVGKQYEYRFNGQFEQSLEQYEESESGQSAKAEVEQYRDLLDTLRCTKPRVLELASTMVEFFGSCRNWEAAQSRTAEFKAEGVDSPMMRDARELAEAVVGFEHAEDG